MGKSTGALPPVARRARAQVPNGPDRAEDGDRRSPLVCPTCGQTHVGCQGCGQLFDAVTLRDGYAHLVNRDDPYPEDGNDAPDDEPCP